MDNPAEAAHIVFTPSGRRGQVTTGTTVLEAARSLGVDLDSVCGGRALCGRCQVVPVPGEFPKHGIVSGPDDLSPFGDDETTYRDRRGLAPDRRLGCKTAILGDVVVDVPPESQLHRQVVRKRLEVRDLTIDPALRLHYVEVPPASLDGVGSDTSRLLDALEEQWGLSSATVAPRTVAELQAALNAGEGAVTIAVRSDTVVACWPGLRDVGFGVAFDVGSTTIAGHLCDLYSGDTLASAGRMNPQIRFGEDLMSRVSYVMMNPDGANELTETVRRALDELVGELTAEAGIERSDILELTVVGNPIMHHLVFGFDVRPLGEAPFALATGDPLDIPAAHLGIEAHPASRVHALPCIAGHVGADAAAAILSEQPHRSADVQLLVDVGTNAEIILGNADRLLAASSPTGPAFEGAQISSGQRAAPGAIERVRIDRESLAPRFKVIGSDAWSNDDGFDAEIADIGVSGICGSGIIEAIGELYLAGLLTPDGRFAPDAAQRCDRIEADGRTSAYRLTDQILVTQNDVRAIQLAKAALYAGIRLLMEHLGVEQVDQIRLAGAFGSHIDVFYAMVIGLIPDCALERVSAAGNAAGTGAVIALLDRSARAEIERVVGEVEKIETAVEPRFQEHFVDAMAFPHAGAAHPELSQHVALPHAVGRARADRRSKEPT